MNKDKMLKEIEFPILGERIFNMQTMYRDFPQENNFPCEGTWILCILRLNNDLNAIGLYKWKKENNPLNISMWTYINIRATYGLVRYIEYPHKEDDDIKDDKVILICDEKKKDLRIRIVNKKL